MFHYCVFPTGWGWMGAVESEKGVRQVVLPQSSAYNVHRMMRTHNGYGQLQEGTAHSCELCLRLKSYIDGERVSFEDKLDIAEATPFQLMVWEAARSIPWGETRCYAWIAQRIGRPQSYRAVGQALAANPVPIIVPCHRVLGKTGALTGFRDGVALKRHLLDMEASDLPFNTGGPGHDCIFLRVPTIA